MAATTPTVLLDTSVAVPFLVAAHPAHDSVSEALAAERIALSGHAAFETFSVLTRLPSPLRREPATVARVIQAGIPAVVHLDPERSGDLLTRLGANGVAGGSVYDALVAEAAVQAARPLLTRDRRAMETYALMGAEVHVLP